MNELADHRRRLLASATLTLLACARPAASLVTVHRERTETGTRLMLIGAPGARINARLVPALERENGTVLRFHGAGLTADSSYFTAPPTLEVSGDPAGVIRASVCPAGEVVCRMLELHIAR